MIFIVSRSYNQAAFWAEECGLPSKDWRYVAENHSHEILAGVNDPDVRFVGQYQYRYDLREINDMIIERRSTP